MTVAAAAAGRGAAAGGGAAREVSRGAARGAAAGGVERLIAGRGRPAAKPSTSSPGKSSGKGAGINGRRLLVAEFLVCLVVLALSPLTDRHRDEGPTAFLRRASAVCLLFFILALVSAGGRGAARVAAAFGGLVTLTLLVSSRSIFTVLAAKFNSRSDGPPGPPAEGDVEPGVPDPGVRPPAVVNSIGAQLGEAVAVIGQQAGRFR